MTEYDEALLEAADSLRPLPTSVLELIAVVGRPDTEVTEISRILETDPNLLAHVLRDANSVGAGGRGDVATAQDAVVRLGAARVASLATAASIAEQLDVGVVPYCLDPGDLGRHARLAGYAGSALRDEIRGVLPAETSTAAVLHDLGKPLIGKVLRSVDERQFARAHELDLDWGTIERELIGIEHGEVARVVLDHWNLPLEVGEAVQFHHAPDRSEGMLAYGVALANSLAHRLVDPLCEHAPEALTAQAALGISDERLLRIEERLRVQLGDSVPPAATVGS